MCEYSSFPPYTNSFKWITTSETHFQSIASYALGGPDAKEKCHTLLPLNHLSPLEWLYSILIISIKSELVVPLGQLSAHIILSFNISRKCIQTPQFQTVWKQRMNCLFRDPCNDLNTVRLFPQIFLDHRFTYLSENTNLSPHSIEEYNV